MGANGAAADGLAAAIVQGREAAQRAGRPIEQVEDLLDLPGIDRRLLQRALPFLTARNGTAAIDPVTAPGPVLRSLPGMASWEVDRLVGARGQATVLPGTIPLLNDADGQGPPMHRFVRIRSEGVVAAGTRAVREVEVELRPDAQTAFRVLSWSDGSDGRDGSAGPS